MDVPHLLQKTCLSPEQESSYTELLPGTRRYSVMRCVMRGHMKPLLTPEARPLLLPPSRTFAAAPRVTSRYHAVARRR